MGDERILGSSAFAEAVLKRADEDYDRRTLARVRGLEIDHVVSQVCGFFGIEPECIEGSGKQPKVVLARSIVCFLAVAKLGIAGREVARRLGMTPSAVSKALMRRRSDDRSELIRRQTMNFKSEGIT